MRAMRVLLILAVALLLALPAMAAEKRKGGRRGRGGFDFVQRMLRDLTPPLSDEQKAKVADVEKEFAPKLEEAMKKMDVLTPEQKKARDEAMKKARDEGKDRGEVRRAGMAAVTLTDEQKAKQTEARKCLRAIGEQELAKVKEILTPEQKAEVEKRMAERKKRFEGKAKRDQ